MSVPEVAAATTAETDDAPTTVATTTGAYGYARAYGTAAASTQPPDD